MNELTENVSKEEARLLYIRSGCKAFGKWYDDNILRPLLRGELGSEPEELEVPALIVKEARQMLSAKEREEWMVKETARLNNIGITFEKEGRIAEAIQAYEECMAIGYPADWCYRRLQVIYRRKNDLQNLKRVYLRYSEVFGEDKTT